jgi:hypothetical protein
VETIRILILQYTVLPGAKLKQSKGSDETGLFDILIRENKVYEGQAILRCQNMQKHKVKGRRELADVTHRGRKMGGKESGKRKNNTEKHTSKHGES